MSFFKDGLKLVESFRKGSIGFSSEKISLRHLPLLMHLICHDVSRSSKNSQSAGVLQGRDRNLMWQMDDDQGDRKNAAEV